MRSTIDTWLREPSADDAPVRVWRDYVLVLALVTGTAVELVTRDDLAAPYGAAALVWCLAVTLLWRRTHPLPVFVACFGGIFMFDLIGVLVGYGPMELFTSALLLVALYALYRWGSGREMLLAIPLVVGLGVLANVVDYSGVGDVIGGFVVLALVIAVGLAIRYRDRSQAQAQEQIRVQERERLARELHDTVAHHVSAIAIQAQAGRFVAQNGSLDGATEALEIIEEEASRTLSEMRSIVGVLRDQSMPATMTPQHGLADIEALASTTGPLDVVVSLSNELRAPGQLEMSGSGGVGAAAYRIAQESITNARRHSRNASTVMVHVAGDADAVLLTVTNDGEATTPGVPGFGLIGMTERATLLGGSLTAGPAPTGGWVVRATLPVGASR